MIRCPDLRNQYSPPRYRRLAVDLRGSRRGNLHSFAGILGNDVAIKAYREGALPYRIAQSLPHYRHVPSKKTTKSFARPNFSGSQPTFNYDERINQVCRDGQLGIRSVPANLATRR